MEAKLKVSDIKQLLFTNVQGALDDENSEFFKTCDEINRIRGGFDPRELRTEHVRWHRKENWLLTKQEKFPYKSGNPQIDEVGIISHIDLTFDCGLYQAFVSISGHNADIRSMTILIGAFWPPEFQPPTGPIKLR